MAHLYDVNKIPDDFRSDRDFGSLLRLLRVNANLSFRYVARTTSIEEARLLSLETGNCYPSIMPRELNALARLYKVREADLRKCIK